MRSPDCLFFYRQSARSAGIAMMIGPPLIIALMVAFAFYMTAGELPSVFVTIFRWAFAVIAGLIGCSFLVYGLRRVIYGGQWGCFVDRHYLTWYHPRCSACRGRQIPVGDITKFVVQIDNPAGDYEYFYFLETANGRFEIKPDCFANRAAALGGALRAANPAITLEFSDEGRVQTWDPDNPPFGARKMLANIFGGKRKT